MLSQGRVDLMFTVRSFTGCLFLIRRGEFETGWLNCSELFPQVRKQKFHTAQIQTESEISG